MKKPYLLLLAVAGILSGIFFVSCSDDKKDPQPISNPLLLGHWQFEVGLDSLFNKEHQVLSADTVDTEGNDSIYINFQADGKFETTLGDGASGTYRFINEQTLQITNKDGVSDELPILTLTDKELTFVNTDTAYGNGNYSKEYLYFKR